MPIKFKEVGYTYSPKTPYQYQALKDITVDIDEHKIVAIIGETGSGKSTMIQHINGLLIPMTGAVAINDFIITANKDLTCLTLNALLYWYRSIYI